MRKGKGKGEGTIGNGETLPPTTNNNFAYSDRIVNASPSPPSITSQEHRLLYNYGWSLTPQISAQVNEVTRVLERMPPADRCSCPLNLFPQFHRPPPIQLQAILLASDCSPRSLIRHLPSLASSRKVPIIYVKDKKGGSLKLGELVKLKTSIAIGVKAKRSSINQLMEGIISGNNGVET